MPKPRFQLARAFKTARRSSGNVTYASTSWGNFDTGLDLVVPFAEVGDVIEVQACGGQGSETVYAFTDVATIVSGSVVNTFSTGGAESGSSEGIRGWYGTGSGQLSSIAGGAIYTLVAGDISAGTVTLRLRIRCNTASTKTWHATTAYPFMWWARNLGPADQN